MTLAHHDTAQHDQRRRAKGKLFCPQDSRQDHITAGFELPIGLQTHTSAQVIEQQGLMRLGDA